MLFEFIQGFVIDPSQYRETLAVRFPVPPDLRSGGIINGRSGVFCQKDELNFGCDPNEADWLIPEPPLKEDIDNGVEDAVNTVLINRPSKCRPYIHVDHKYIIYMSKNFLFLTTELIVWDLTLIEVLDEPWKVQIGLSGLHFNTTVILPDYNFIDKIHNS